jgi:hypothetical protein
MKLVVRHRAILDPSELRSSVPNHILPENQAAMEY